ncbi:MAG: sugar nucleotide-binding protein [Pseudomonadota bacterium]
MKLLTIGASGYIGKQLYARAMTGFGGYGTSSVGADRLIQLRLDAPADFDYGLILPSDVVFLTAAISAPDICAREHDRAWAVNVTGTSEFITQVIARGARVVFFSSDTVYGERSNTFDETAESQPAGEYAEMKSEVEKRFLGSPLFKSIRLSYVFSREDKFTKYLSGCAERGEEAELFHPFYRAIVHRDDVVEGALALAQRWDEFPQQVINFGGPEVLSRIDFADCLKSAALPNLRYRVTVPGDDFFKNRPRVIAMSSNVLPELLGRSARRLLEAAQIEFASR